MMAAACLSSVIPVPVRGRSVLSSRDRGGAGASGGAGICLLAHSAHIDLLLLLSSVARQWQFARVTRHIHHLPYASRPYCVE
jgi:hypothetical protein